MVISFSLKVSCLPNEPSLVVEYQARPYHDCGFLIHLAMATTRYWGKKRRLSQVYALEPPAWRNLATVLAETVHSSLC